MIISILTTAACENKKGKCRMTRPTEKEISAIARTAGVPIETEVAIRIANSLGPAFDSFAAIAGTLPFDLEPSTFVFVQTEKAV